MTISFLRNIVKTPLSYLPSSGSLTEKGNTALTKATGHFENAIINEASALGNGAKACYEGGKFVAGTGLGFLAAGPALGNLFTLNGALTIANYYKPTDFAKAVLLASSYLVRAALSHPLVPVAVGSGVGALLASKDLKDAASDTIEAVKNTGKAIVDVAYGIKDAVEAAAYAGAGVATKVLETVDKYTAYQDTKAIDGNFKQGKITVASEDIAAKTRQLHEDQVALNEEYENLHKAITNTKSVGKQDNPVKHAMIAKHHNTQKELQQYQQDLNNREDGIAELQNLSKSWMNIISDEAAYEGNSVKEVALAGGNQFDSVSLCPEE